MARKSKNISAEEKLKERLNQEQPHSPQRASGIGWNAGDGLTLRASTSGGVYIAAEDIDLIADLVVERIATSIRGDDNAR